MYLQGRSNSLEACDSSGGTGAVCTADEIEPEVMDIRKSYQKMPSFPFL
jgi:hypothetical protein